MSANIVDTQTIDALVSWSVERDLIDRMGVSGPDELGQILHDENVRSVNHRYNESTVPDTFKYSGNGEDGPLNKENVLGIISHLDYQSCETSDWNSTKANECLAVMECDYIEQFHGGRLSLHGARHPMVVEALVEKGRDPNQSAYPSDDTSQNKPLHNARSPEIAQALIDAGADVNGTNRIGETPLHTLSRFAEPETIKTLVDHGADPMARDRQGNTPLHSTTSYGNAAAASVLVEAGADPLAADNYGSTPIAMAEKNGGIPQTLSVLERGVLVNEAKEAAGQLQANTAVIEDRWAPMRVPSPDARSQANSTVAADLEDEMTPMRVPDPSAKPARSQEAEESSSEEAYTPMRVPDPGAKPAPRSNTHSETEQEEETWSVRRF